MREWEPTDINDTEFDHFLQESIAGLPPDDIAHQVTPWRTAINRILTGFALGTITLDFLGLNYLLPAIGMLLTLLGFRMLRRENHWFFICWILTILRCTLHFSILILYTTIYQRMLSATTLFTFITIGSILLQFAQYFCMWQALRTLQCKAGLMPHAGGMIAMIVWSALICILAAAKVNGWIPIILLLIAYFYILRSLIKLSNELSNAGYCIHTAPVHCSDRVLAVSLVLVVILGCACGYLFFNQYPMDWQPDSRTEDAQIHTIKNHLMGLGFPEHILQDLSNEDILACKDAVRVVVDTQDHPVNRGRQVMEAEGNHINIHTVYDQKELRLTGVGVELTGQPKQWKIFHHFQWVIKPDFYGTDVLHLWPAYHNNRGWVSCGDLTGQVLYNNGDRIYVAPYYSLDSETYTANSIFWGEQTSTDIFATFSMPPQGSNYRGYVSYCMEQIQEGWIVDAWINYTHQVSPLQYPVLTAKGKHMTAGVSDTTAFITVQDALQFLPRSNDEDAEN